jgi:uncharacterized membrane protein YeiB
MIQLILIAVFIMWISIPFMCLGAVVQYDSLYRSNYSAKEWDQMRKLAKAAYFVCPIWAVVSFLLLYYSN